MQIKQYRVSEKNMDKNAFVEGIKKTGFVLENKIAEILSRSKWNVISNKYYLDDHEEAVREIDIVAYRTSKVEHIELYTALIISCKKSEQKTWAFLSRDLDRNDPNSNLWPLHAWTNDKILNHQLCLPEAGKNYHIQGKTMGVQGVLDDPVFDIFAFQEMESANGTAKNQTAIFAAITSLMKAQSYEIRALPLRKSKPAVYQFNLINVLDGEMVRLMFKNDDITCEEIETEQYLAQYIVNKANVFSKIRFVKSENFEIILTEYEKLHQANKEIFKNIYDDFYTDVFNDTSKELILNADFFKSIKYELFSVIELEFQNRPNIKSCWLNKDNTKDILYILVNLEEIEVKKINGDTKFMALVKKKLEEIFRYKGKFEFEKDIF